MGSDMGEGRYRTIVADPPWHQRTGAPNLHAPAGGGPSRLVPYPTMTVEEICALPVSEMAAREAHLYLWTTNRYLSAAYDVARAWGFNPNPGTMLVWCKAPKGRGLGEGFSLATEYCLFCTRGGLKVQERVDRNWWLWQRQAHSQKPEAFLDLVEQVSPAPRLELFARRNRIGWDTWGNQALNHVTIEEAG